MQRASATRTQRLSGVVVLLLAAGAATMSYGLGLGTLRQPGPGLWPFAVSVVMALAAAGLTVTRGHEVAGEESSGRLGVVALATASLVGYVALFAAVGFAVPTFLAAVFWLRAVARESWPLTAILSVAITVVGYVLFAMVLGVPFPAGPLTPLLPR